VDEAVDGQKQEFHHVKKKLPREQNFITSAACNEKGTMVPPGILRGARHVRLAFAEVTKKKEPQSIRRTKDSATVPILSGAENDPVASK